MLPVRCVGNMLLPPKHVSNKFYLIYIHVIFSSLLPLVAFAFFAFRLRIKNSIFSFLFFFFYLPRLLSKRSSVFIVRQLEFVCCCSCCLCNVCIDVVARCPAAVAAAAVAEAAAKAVSAAAAAVLVVVVRCCCC